MGKLENYFKKNVSDSLKIFGEPSQFQKIQADNKYSPAYVAVPLGPVTRPVHRKIYPLPYRF
ncbi:MAG: hypothetical protein V1678_05040 [Candidatus Aenigmatarchaeota archaeon]